MLKTLLFQLLSFRIGDLDLFSVILQAYTDSETLSSAGALEELLWNTLRHALSDISSDNDEVAIIIDGMDQMEGLKPAAKQLSAKLQGVAQDTPGLRLLLFSQPFGMDVTKSVERIELSLDNISDDLRIVLHQGLSRHTHFASRDFIEQESIVDSLFNLSDGSMLYATLLVEYLSQQKTLEGFASAFGALQESPPQNLSGLVQRLLGVTKLDSESRSVLSFLVAAKRPLSFNEIDTLLRAEIRNVNTERPIRLSYIKDSIAAFTVNVEGLVFIRHDGVKQALLNIPDTSEVSLHLKERHKDLLIRLLASTGKYLRDVDEPRLEFLTLAEMDKRLASHRLLEYTIRYWVVHFKKSSLFKIQGQIEFPHEFISVFPRSVTFALLEASRWRTQYLPDEVVELFTVAYRVRKQLFGLEHASVLQSAIACAVFYDSFMSQYSRATEWYALAIRIGKTVLSPQSELIITCCTTLLRISEKLVTKKRTEIMTYREEILLVLVSSYSHQYGTSSQEVLQIYEALAELYVSIGEETKALEIQVKVRGIRTGFIDHTHLVQDSASRHLDVVLKRHDHEQEINGFDSLLFGYKEETEETWTIVHVEHMIKLALELNKRGQFGSAEEIYVELWLKLSDHCLSTQLCEWHEKKIDVMLKYASFLHAQKRVEEASAVLTCCWDEYSTHHVSMFESIIVLLKEVAVSMKLVGMISLSLTVFQRCWSWFKSTRKEENQTFKQIVEYIAVTSSEVVARSSATKTSTVTSASETVIREVFESSLSTSEETQVTTTTMELCNSLTALYIEQEKWSEAVSVLKSTLRRTWASLFAESIESVSLDASYSSESIRLVLDLAQCYINQKRYEKTEHLYLRLYRVHCKSLKFDDSVVIGFRDLYIEFLTKYEMHSVLIAFYQELLVEYRSFYGPDHANTIGILYALGDLCRNHYLTHGYWIEYYAEIINTLNKGARICHQNALRALIVVAEYYYELHRHSESLVYLKSIIATFCQFGTKYTSFQDTAFVQKTLERYSRVIEETQIETHEYIIVLKEVRQACSKFFGEASEIALSVTVTLAEVCSKNEKYEYEAVAYYEHILTHSKTLTTTTVKRSQNTLRTLYVKQISSTTSSTKVTKEMIEKATTMTYERYAEIQRTHSCTHETTLNTLNELILLYQKQQRTDLVTKELQTHVTQCVLSTSTTKELIEAAREVARIFSVSYASYAVQLIREIKLQVIYKTMSKTSAFNVTSAGRSCFAFIASLEYHLGVRSDATIAGYMAELLAEYLFYDRLTSSIKRKAKIGSIILLGARLRYIHFRSKRAEDFDLVEQQVIQYFISAEEAVVKASTQASIRGFVRILLAYFSQHGQPKDFVASAARAAVAELKEYLKNAKYREALGLAQCIFRFLMAHEGLDDPTEITLGFQLCLMMAGRGEYKSNAINEDTKAMLTLSQSILAEVFDICANNKIDLARCPLRELNELVSLLGDQKDSRRLLWLLETLWNSRGGQPWSSDVKLTLGTRLVQARCAAGDLQVAARLAEDIVYNLRRTSGPRHRHTLATYELLASIYTSAGHHFATEKSVGAAGDNKKKSDAAVARSYFKKAVTVNEDLLKLLVETDADDSDDDDDDTFSVASGSLHGSVRAATHGGLGSGAGRRVSAKRSSSMLLALAQHSKSDASAAAASGVSSRHHEAPREVLVEVARKHLRLAKLAVQRYGGWDVLTGRQFEGLTSRIWREYGAELKLKEEQVLSARWKVTGYGNGKAEGGIEEDGFVAPDHWVICELPTF